MNPYPADDDTNEEVGRRDGENGRGRNRRTDGRTVDMTESESGEEESGEGREKGGSFDLHGGREGRRQSRSHPFAASVVLAAEEREMKIVGEKSAIRPSRLRPDAHDNE